MEFIESIAGSREEACRGAFVVALWLTQEREGLRLDPGVNVYLSNLLYRERHPVQDALGRLREKFTARSIREYFSRLKLFGRDPIGQVRLSQFTADSFTLKLKRDYNEEQLAFSKSCYKIASNCARSIEQLASSTEPLLQQRDPPISGRLPIFSREFFETLEMLSMTLDEGIVLIRAFENYWHGNPQPTRQDYIAFGEYIKELSKQRPAREMVLWVDGKLHYLL